MKCKKCKYYYCKMIGKGGLGYNPFPFCHLYDDEGEHPQVLTQACYKPRKKPKK